MTLYERAHLAAGPFLPVLHSRVRRDLRHLLNREPALPASILDVGGRKSPYTAGLRASVTILELPRESELQKRLNLGISDEALWAIRRRRSNVAGVVLEDMTRCSLPSHEFDGVISVEVLEHVPEDEAFVAQVARVVKRGGWFYVTTPNGDYIRNEPPDYNPDHRRHYTRAGLRELLSRHFDRVTVVYGVRTGKHRFRGLRSFELRHLSRTAAAMLSNLVSHWESRGLDEEARRTAHLFATAWKA